MDRRGCKAAWYLSAGVKGIFLEAPNNFEAPVGADLLFPRKAMRRPTSSAERMIFLSYSAVPFALDSVTSWSPEGKTCLGSIEFKAFDSTIKTPFRWMLKIAKRSTQFCRDP